MSQTVSCGNFEGKSACHESSRRRGCNFAEGQVVESVWLVFFVVFQYRVANSNAFIADVRTGGAIWWS
jgi:hypothetical protein